ncbi:MAG TPA: amidohydrolase family protein, partial [Gemmataceae bacterium]|nr:amidohydrolase family protein [Gemmataceae bacterium]
HFTYSGPPIIDLHAHVTMTSPEDKPAGPAGGWGDRGSSDAAAMMLEVGAEFGIGLTVSMCPPQDVAPLRARLGDRLLFNGMINKKPDEPDDAAYRNLDQFLEAGIKIVKLWSAPRGRERGLLIDAPWRLEGLRRAYKAGVRIVMVHVGDPDVWWTHTYQDTAKFGTKPDQYPPFMRTIELFPEFAWIGAHMGGDSEHPDHLEAMLEKHPNLYFDTSATKWQVREVSPRREEIRSLICRHPTRFLFGTDLVTRHGLTREHYVSRYWCQRTLWESTWEGPSPIADPDFQTTEGGPRTPTLRGVGLPPDVLRRVYVENARHLLNLGG